MADADGNAVLAQSVVTLDGESLVMFADTQTITGDKTFTGAVDLSGATVTYDAAPALLAGAQTITGAKTLSGTTVISGAATLSGATTVISGTTTLSGTTEISGAGTHSGACVFTKDAKEAVVFEPAAGAGRPDGSRDGFSYQFHQDANGDGSITPEGTVLVTARTDDEDVLGQKMAVHVVYSAKTTPVAADPSDYKLAALYVQSYVGSGEEANMHAAAFEVRDVDDTCEGKKLAVEASILHMGEAGGTGDSVIDGLTPKYALWCRGKSLNVAGSVTATAALAMNNGEGNFHYGLFVRRCSGTHLWMEAPGGAAMSAIKVIGPSATEEVSGGAAPTGTWASALDIPNVTPIRGRNFADNAYVDVLTFDASDEAVLGPAVKALDSLAVANAAEGGTGRLKIQTTREVHTLAAAGTSDTTTISVPAGAMLLGCSLTVNTAVSDDGGDDTWAAAFVTGSTTVITAAGTAAAQNTKVDTLFVPEITGGVAEIRFTAQGGSFDGGVIECVVYYADLTSLANA